MSKLNQFQLEMVSKAPLGVKNWLSVGRNRSGVVPEFFHLIRRRLFSLQAALFPSPAKLLLFTMSAHWPTARNSIRRANEANPSSSGSAKVRSFAAGTKVLPSSVLARELNSSAHRTMRTARRVIPALFLPTVPWTLMSSYWESKISLIWSLT